METPVIIACALLLALFVGACALRVLDRRFFRRRGQRTAMVVIRKAPVVQLQRDAVQQPDCSYEWDSGDSAGLPAIWKEDLLLRRN